MPSCTGGNRQFGRPTVGTACDCQDNALLRYLCPRPDARRRSAKTCWIAANRRRGLARIGSEHPRYGPLCRPPDSKTVQDMAEHAKCIIDTTPAYYRSHERLFEGLAGGSLVAMIGKTDFNDLNTSGALIQASRPDHLADRIAQIWNYDEDLAQRADADARLSFTITPGHPAPVASKMRCAATQRRPICEATSSCPSAWL